MKTDSPLFICLTIMVGVLVILVVMWISRQFSSAITTIKVQDVAPGIQCATMITGDGSAIDCWKVQETGI